MNHSNKLLLFPFGGNTREALLSIFAINQIQKKWDIIGFIDDDPSLWGNECCGVKVLGGRNILDSHPSAKVLAAQGNPNNFLNRKEIIDNLAIEESRFATILHPSVAVSPDAKIGYNVLLMPNVVVNCGVEIGNHCFSLPNTVFAHDCVIADYCCFGSNITISGYVSIDQNCYIGSGSRIKNNITISERVLVGIGSNVVSDIEKNVVVAGNPAKILKKF